MPNVHFLKNLAPEEFLELLLHARVIVGNSSVGIREAAFFGTPTVNIGSRQSGRDHGPNVIHVPYDKDAISQAIETQLANGPYSSSQLFGDGHAGERIADHMASVELTTVKRIAY